MIRQTFAERKQSSGQENYRRKVKETIERILWDKEEKENRIRRDPNSAEGTQRSKLRTPTQRLDELFRVLHPVQRQATQVGRGPRFAPGPLQGKGTLAFRVLGGTGPAAQVTFREIRFREIAPALVGASGSKN